MTTTTVRPASVQSDGFIRSDHGTYATARASYNAGTNNNTLATMTSGQRLNGGTNQLFQTPARMDCSSIPATDTASVAVIELTKSGNSGQMLYLMAADAGATVDSADWVAGATLAASTKLGEADFSAIGNDTPTQFTLNAAGLAAVQAAIAGAGFFAFTIVSQPFIDGTAPSGDDRTGLHSSEAATAAYRPALIVTHSGAVDVVLAAGIGAAAGGGQTAVLAADQVLAVAIGAASAAGQVVVVLTDQVPAPGTGAASATGQPAMAVTDQVLAPAQGAAVADGTAATPVADQVAQAAPGSAVAEGQPAVPVTDQVLAPGAGAAAAAGMTAQVVADLILAAGIGTAAASGQPTVLAVNANVVLSAGVGAAIAEGFIAGLSLDAILVAAVGAAAADGSIAVIDASTIDEILAEISFALAIESRSAFAPAVTGQVHMAAAVDSRARVAGAVDAQVSIRPAIGSK